MFPSSPKLLFYLYNFWGYLRLFSPNKKSGFMYKEFKEELFALIQSM